MLLTDDKFLSTVERSAYLFHLGMDYISDLRNSIDNYKNYANENRSEDWCCSRFRQ